VVRRGTTCLCGSDRRAPDRRAGPRRAVRRLVTILRREAAAGVSAALLHIADACCPAGVAVPPAWPAGKEPRNFGLHRDKQLAVVRQLTDIIQRPPATPALADRTWVLLTEAPEAATRGFARGLRRRHCSGNASTRQKHTKHPRRLQRTPKSGLEITAGVRAYTRSCTDHKK
jgi:hypothetical protein